MSDRFTDHDRLAIQTIRTLSIDAIQKANSGHPGLPLGAAPMAYVLWRHHLRFDPAMPDWPDRDRFVLSAGHGSMLLYAMLHLAGFDVAIEDLLAFRQWGSRTPGHPEFGMTAGVEATTGPLGQGTGNAVGMAMAERFLAQKFNTSEHTVVDHRTFALVSDGDLMEGLSAEAASLAGHLGLGKLTYLYDANDISLDGPLSLTFSREDVAKRYEAHGWHVLRVEDGDHDLDAIDRALTAAARETTRPSLIIVRTTIGFGSPNKQGTHHVHGAPLGEEELVATKKALGWTYEPPFHVPAPAREGLDEAASKGEVQRFDWEERMVSWAAAHADLAATWQGAWSGELPQGWDEDLPRWEAGEKVATRAAAGNVLNALALKVPWLLGGDADLSGSTKTHLKDEASFDSEGKAGRNIHFGVREHAMGAAVNGMLNHGGVRPYASTFFCFSDYMRPSVRLAALSELPAIYVWTHDSVAVGEDGPTHQPVEHLMSLRAMPNLAVVRPGDANEAAQAWKLALQRQHGPTALVLSRQGLPTIDREKYASAEGVQRGAYVLADPAGVEAQALILATGSELHLAVAAHELLVAQGIATRVVSMPCWETFEAQDEDYRRSVLPESVTARVAVEAGVTLGWSRWVGARGKILGIDRFGASAPGGENLERFGFTVDAVVAAVREVIAGAGAQG